MATDTCSVAARAEVAPPPRSAARLVDERPPASLVRATLQTRRSRPPQDRAERAHEHALEPIDPLPSDGVEGDDVSAAGLGLEMREHG